MYTYLLAWGGHTHFADKINFMKHPDLNHIRCLKYHLYTIKIYISNCTHSMNYVYELVNNSNTPNQYTFVSNLCAYNLSTGIADHF